MSNLPPAIFIGPLNAEKRFSGSKSEKITFPHEFPQGPLWTSRTQRWQQVLRLLPKKATHVAKNFRSCKGCSQLSVDIFMASGDLLVAQKSYFFQKSLQKTPGYSKFHPD